MNKWILGLLVLAAGVGVGWYVLQGQKPAQEGVTQPETSTQMPATPGVEEMIVSSPAAGEAGGITEKGGVAARTVVTYTDTGFAPNMVTMRKGTTVSFVNESSKGMWVASAVHPTHQLLPGFNQLKSVTRGGTYEYTFDKVGTWKYHNHVSPADTGSVVVTE